MASQDLFNALFNASPAAMIPTLVASLGIGLTVRQLLAPLSSVGLPLAIGLFLRARYLVYADSERDTVFPSIGEAVKARKPTPTPSCA